MAANAIYCTTNTNDTIDFSGQTIPIGSFITATDNVPPTSTDVLNCFQTTDVTIGGGAFTATTETYSSCYDCLVNNYTLVTVDFCDEQLTGIQVDISQFGYIPTENEVYFVSLTLTGSNYTTCINVTSVTQYSENEYNTFVDNGLAEIEFLSTAPFPDCGTCTTGFTSGNEATVCNVCWDGSGYTQTVIKPPHPRWTNQYGQTVIQLDAITLGGQYGLNN